MYIGGDKIHIKPQAAWSDEVEAADVPIVGPGEDQTEHHKNHISCIRNGGTPNCNIDLALRVQAMLSMAEMSYRQSTWRCSTPKSSS